MKAGCAGINNQIHGVRAKPKNNGKPI